MNPAKLYEFQSGRDVVLIAGIDGKKFPVHRMVMFASSEYYEKLFGPNFAEGNQSEVTIADVDGETLSAIIQFCYTRKVELNENNLSKIAKAARIQLIQPLEQECSKSWNVVLKTTNCVQFYSDFLEFEDQARIILNFICLNFEKVPKTDLISLQYEAFFNIIRNEKIYATEDTILQAIVQWYESDKMTRMNNVNKLIECVILDRISSELIANDSVKRLIAECNVKEIERHVWELARSANRRTIYRAHSEMFILLVAKQKSFRIYFLDPQRKTLKLFKEHETKYNFITHNVVNDILYSYTDDKVIETSVTNSEQPARIVCLENDESSANAKYIPCFHMIRAECNRWKFNMDCWSGKDWYTVEECNIHNHVYFLGHSYFLRKGELRSHQTYLGILRPSSHQLQKANSLNRNLCLLRLNKTWYAVDFVYQENAFMYLEDWIEISVSGEIISNANLSYVGVEDKVFIMNEQEGKLYEVRCCHTTNDLIVELIELTKEEEVESLEGTTDEEEKYFLFCSKMEDNMSVGYKLASLLERKIKSF